MSTISHHLPIRITALGTHRRPTAADLTPLETDAPVGMPHTPAPVESPRHSLRPPAVDRQVDLLMSHAELG